MLWGPQWLVILQGRTSNISDKFFPDLSLVYCIKSKQLIENEGWAKNFLVFHINLSEQKLYLARRAGDQSSSSVRKSQTFSLRIQVCQSRKDLTTDGDVGDCEKAKILAQFNNPNNDKTWRDSEDSQSYNSTEERTKSTKYVIRSRGSTSNWWGVVWQSNHMLSRNIYCYNRLRSSKICQTQPSSTLAKLTNWV